MGSGSHAVTIHPAVSAERARPWLVYGGRRVLFGGVLEQVAGDTLSVWSVRATLSIHAKDISVLVCVCVCVYPHPHVTSSTASSLIKRVLFLSVGVIVAVVSECLLVA